MDLSNFGEFRKKEIITRPYENLKSIDVSDGTFFFSHKGSDANGNYEWETISDSSFQLRTIDQLLEDQEFVDKLLDSCNKHEVKPMLENADDFKLTLRNLYDESLGFGLPFTLLDADAFNKELLYHNAREQAKSQGGYL